MAFDVHSIPLGPWQTNALILQSTNHEVTVCDPGMDPAPLLRHLEEHALHVKQIILTHAHVDHIAGIDAVSGRFDDPPLLVHPEEEEWLNRPELNLSAALRLRRHHAPGNWHHRGWADHRSRGRRGNGVASSGSFPGFDRLVFQGHWHFDRRRHLVPRFDRQDRFPHQ